MGTLMLHRQSGFWMDKARAYNLLVDSEHRATIKDGEDIEVEIPAGPHDIQMKIDWCSSPIVTIDGSFDNKLVCKPNGSPALVLLYITLLRSSYISLRRAN